MAKSVVDIALERIDAQIADFQRARDIIAGAAVAPSEDAPKVRKPRKRKGMPADQGI